MRKRLQHRTLPMSTWKKKTRKHCPSLRRQNKRSAKMQMMMKSLKTKKMKDRLGAKIRKRSVEVKRLLILVKMRQLRSKKIGRRKRVDVVALRMKLRLTTPTEETTTVVLLKVRKKVVVIEVAIVNAIAIKAKVEIARIKSEEAETRKKEVMVIERRNVVVGMRMTAGTVMPRSVVANAMMVRTINPPPRNLEGRIEIVAIAVTVIVVTVIVVIVIGIMVGIEVRVKRRGDEKKLNKQKSQICKCVAFTCYRLK